MGTFRFFVSFRLVRNLSGDVFIQADKLASYQADKLASYQADKLASYQAGGTLSLRSVT